MNLMKFIQKNKHNLYYFNIALNFVDDLVF